jgi:chromate transport protein ChrA
VSRALALLAFPVAAFVLGIVLVAFNRNAAASPDQALILFGVRATAAALMALAHLRWLKAALAALDAEGALKDI